MRKAISLLGVGTMALAMFSLVASAADKTMSWTGWISNSTCGAKDASAAGKACTEACIKKGATYVFVDSKSKKVIKIDNQDAVNADADLGHEVAVTGSMMKGSVHVDKIEAKM